ncbi:MAG: DNA translocase FtsK [Erysipelotrichaceae bacterium]|nr:DNA translocase FtsK [Erysipelotrichaceae bacterium]
MAKTKRKRKSKQDIFEENLKIRIISIIIIAFIIIAAMKLGIIGSALNSCMTFLVGNLYGIAYIGLLACCVYTLYKAKLPRLTGPHAVGLYLMFVSILIIACIPANQDAKGIGVINTYIQSGIWNKGGMIGMLLFGILSSLFDILGTLIIADIILIIGCALLFSSVYFKYKTNNKKKPKPKKSKEPKIKEPKIIEEKPEKNENVIILREKPRFFDPFSKPKDTIIFPDEVFDDPKDKDLAKEKTQAFEINQEKMKIDIVDSDDKKDIHEIKEEAKPIIHSDDYKLPPISLLQTRSTTHASKEKNIAKNNGIRLTNVLQEFGVNATIENAFIGPAITKYELKLETGTRVNKILQLQDDIKLALATADIRIEAPIPGKPYVGIEVPNSSPAVVAFKDVYKSLMNNPKYADDKLVVALGKDVSGNPVYAHLDKMPHLLIAGATGSGKSVCVNTIITSILMRAKPDEVKLILVDPKKVELSIYNDIPHLAFPVVTDAKKAAGVLQEVVSDMEDRYEKFAQVNAKNIQTYNQYIKKQNMDKDPSDQLALMPYKVVILDEVADLMMVASKVVEDCIMRISQMARAAGIHMIVATQRPSTDIITGVIKANIPSRIAFAVSSGIDSRTILDTTGAEKLLGRGDMLFSPMGSSSPTRVQGCFVSDEEVQSIVDYIKNQQEVKYEKSLDTIKAVDTSSSHIDDDEEDEEYEECRQFVIQAQKASTSLLQRKFRIGYNKAARIIDRLEEEGVIGPQLGSKPREVYIRQYNEEDV